MRSALLALAVMLTAALTMSVDADVPEVRVRMPFSEIMNNQAYAKQRDLLILSLERLKELDPDNIDSWYQIGGIHGMPAAPFDGVMNETSPFNYTRWLGYCDHSGVIFPTWHRPYVLQLEHSIRKHAMEIAGEFEFQFGLNVYKEAAEQLMWPFWDWAADQVVPKELTDLSILVRVPPRMKWVRRPNPFYSYTFQKTTTSGPEYTAEKLSPFYSPEGSVTLRYPYPDNSTNSGFASNQTYQVDIFSELYNITHNWVMDLFNIGTWECFSNRGDQITNPLCSLQSLESVHNWIHLYIGGFQPVGLGSYTGHMSLLQTAGFDPAFFLHHCNVDRLLALWQSFWPGVWVTPAYSTGGTYMYDAGQPLNKTSPLYPFKFASGPSQGEFVSSIDVVDTRALGYTYPDIADLPSFGDLYATLAAKYGPVRTGWRWFVHFNCTSSDPAAEGGFSINSSFVYNGVTYSVDDVVSPVLMSIGTMQLRTGVNNNGQVVMASEVTRAFIDAGVPSDPAPIDGDYSKGPSTPPLDAIAFPSACISSTEPGVTYSPCTCSKYLLWAWNADPSTPFGFYTNTVTPGMQGWGGTYTT